MNPWRSLSLCAAIACACLGASPNAWAGGVTCSGGGTYAPPAALDGALLGSAVAVAGNDVLMGAPGAGSVWVYRRGLNGTYALIGQLPRPSALLSSSGFGSEISVDGSIAAIGAPNHNSNQGAVVIYSRASNGTWSFLQTITSPLSSSAAFGLSVSIRDGFLAIGAPSALNALGYQRGVVYLYARQPTTSSDAGKYALPLQIDPSEPAGAQNKWFGWGVGMSNSTLVISAPGERLSVDGSFQGSVYVYRRSALGAWAAVVRKKSPGAAGGIYGTDLAVGSDGVNGLGASFFVREQRPANTDAVWAYKTLEGIPTLAGAQEAAQTPIFGGQPAVDVILTNTLAVHEGTALIGSPKENFVNQMLFTAGGWAHDRFWFLPVSLPTGGTNRQFGQGVAIGRDQIAMGAPEYIRALNDEPGVVDIRTHALPDCDSDGFFDACEILDASAVDANSNGVPDACETVAKPVSLTASSGTLTTGVSLVWPMVPRAVRYKISVVIEGVETEVGFSYCAQFLDTSAPVGVLRAYRVRSESSAGTLSGDSAAASGWRGITAVTGLTATDGTSLTSVTVAWSAVEGATGYKVIRVGGSPEAEVTLATVTELTYSDTTAIAGLLYAYRVQVLCAAGVGPLSEPNTGWINTAAVPLSVAASDGTSATSITVTWTAPEGGAVGYTILRGAGSKSPAVIANVGAADRTFTDLSVPKASTIYRYYIRLATATSGGMWDAGWKAPPGPTAVAATDGSSTAAVTVTWLLAPKSSKVSGYRVYRAASGGEPVLLGVVGKTVKTYSDNSAVPGVLYTYSVRAAVALGLTPAVADTGWRKLSAPAAIAATDTLTTKIAVTWLASPGATSYLVTRVAAGVTENFTSALSPYDDLTASPGVTYTYTVRAVSAQGNSEPSVSDTGIRLAPGFRLMAGGGSGGGGTGQDGSLRRFERAKSGDADAAESRFGDCPECLDPKVYLVDRVRLVDGLFVMDDHDSMVVALRDPSAASEASMLVVSSGAVLGGQLTVVFDGYAPKAGDRWTVIVAGSGVGDFARLRVRGVPAGMRIEGGWNGGGGYAIVILDGE